MVRAWFFAAGMAIIMLPVTILSGYFEIHSVWPSVIYLLVVCPIFVPNLLSLVGLKSTLLDEIDGGPGLNEAGRRKMEQMRREGEERHFH